MALVFIRAHATDYGANAPLKEQCEEVYFVAYTSEPWSLTSV